MTPIPPIHQAQRYIGQSETIVGLQQLLDAARSNAACRVAYIEASGGLGKTFLLMKLPDLIGPQRAYIVRIIDLNDTNNRNSSFLEDAIIEGLRTTKGQAYRVNDAEWQAAFAHHRALRQRFDIERGRLAGAELERRRHELRATFIESLNTISAQRPLILRFDTTESLMSEPPEPALAELLAQVGVDEGGPLTFPSALDLFFGWFADVIPQLKKTLVVLCGRHPEGAQNGLSLYERCQTLPALTTTQFTLDTLSRPEAAEYLKAMAAENAPALKSTVIEDAYTLTEGVPLLLASYAWLLDMDHAPAFSSTVINRRTFERHLVGKVLNPTGPMPFDRQLLAYCLYLLSYARRGLYREQLDSLLRSLNCPKAYATFTAEECQQYTQLFARLGEVALIKERPQEPLLYLHDEVHRMIDELQIADTLDLRDEVLERLLALAHTEVAEKRKRRARTLQDRAALLVAISNRIYYALEISPVVGYHQYLQESIRFFDRERDLALILRDELWRWVNMRATDAEGRVYQPKRKQLTGLARNVPNRNDYATSGEQPLTLRLHEIQTDDLVWLMKYYIACNENLKAVRVGEQAYREFRPLRLDDAFFKFDLALHLAIALNRFHNQEVLESDAPRLFEEAIALAEQVRDNPTLFPASFFKDRVNTFLGLARNEYGYMWRSVLDYDKAAEQYTKALRIYASITGASETVAQIKINLAYVYARMGNFDAAQKILAELRRDIRQNPVSADRHALILNNSSILETERGRPDDAEAFVLQARDIVAPTGNERVMALINAQFGRVRHEKIKRPPYEVDTAAEEYFQAAIAFFQQAGEGARVCDTQVVHARYLRTLALNERRRAHGGGDVQLVKRWFQAALNELNAAEQTITTKRDSKVVSVVQAEIDMERAFIYRLRQQPDEAAKQLDRAEDLLRSHALPRSALVIAANVAFERAWLLADQGRWAPTVRQLLVALAHCRLFALNDRTRIRFYDVIRLESALLSHEILQQIVDVLSSAEATTQPKERDVIPLGAPTEHWATYWYEELAALQTMIEVQLHKRS